MYIGKTQTIAILILSFGEVHVRNAKIQGKSFTEEEIADAKKALMERGFTFGLCDHCKELSWITTTICTCGNHRKFKKICTKRLCGLCERLYPPAKLRRLFAYYARENVPLKDTNLLGREVKTHE